jgi:hypothetical protein
MLEIKTDSNWAESFEPCCETNILVLLSSSSILVQSLYAIPSR